MNSKDIPTSVKTRIAPSPTGAPHIGTAYAALFNWALAQKNKGKFLLRIEDTDQSRIVKGAQDQISEALKWLGLNWDEGPILQSQRLPIYKKHAEKLVAEDKAYYCFCSSSRLEQVRKSAQKKGLPPKYDGRCRALDPKEAKKRTKSDKFVIRLKVPHEGESVFNDLIRGEVRFKNELINDQVLIKSDGFPTYHLAVVVDDYLMGVTHVLRGEEWISSTPKHVLLYQAFGWELPKFAHLPILRETDKSKLSKRHGSVGILEFKEKGYLPEALLNFLALLGWSHPKEKEIFDLDEFVKNFDVSRVSTSAPVFDRDKLDWMNGEYIRKLPDDELARRIAEYLKKYRGVEVDLSVISKAVPIVKERIKNLGDFDSLAGFFFTDVAWTKETLLGKRDSSKSASEKLITITEEYEKQKTWDAGKMEKFTRYLAEEKGWEVPNLFMLLRIAVTGQEVSPPLFESMEVLGRERTISRLNGALSVIRRN